MGNDKERSCNAGEDLVSFHWLVSLW